jgi:hypothetical protein
LDSLFLSASVANSWQNFPASPLENFPAEKKAIKGAVLFQILAELTGWIYWKAWTGPCNTAIYN